MFHPIVNNARRGNDRAACDNDLRKAFEELCEGRDEGTTRKAFLQLMQDISVRRHIPEDVFPTTEAIMDTASHAFRIGDKVMGRHKTGSWYPAVIVEVPVRGWYRLEVAEIDSQASGRGQSSTTTSAASTPRTSPLKGPKTENGAAKMGQVHERFAQVSKGPPPTR